MEEKLAPLHNEERILRLKIPQVRHLRRYEPSARQLWSRNCLSKCAHALHNKIYTAPSNNILVNL